MLFFYGTQLAECVPAIGQRVGADGNMLHCTNLSVQQGCFGNCGKDPSYSNYMSSPNTGRAFKPCGITIPACPWRLFSGA
ncbi:hypothetical protein PR202_ga07510 [Eleusine coracana subsp. coracana]|uniref:Uncharacterized protein n=1 Tax=Eleusine coracana subsp. coracana TaxID=191504 RepID=A0AAV5C050_ELECO|nr:hypothetical protein PR202_ga07510 [Eleusine coracana subsp. coracana]